MNPYEGFPGRVPCLDLVLELLSGSGLEAQVPAGRSGLAVPETRRAKGRVILVEANEHVKVLQGRLDVGSFAPKLDFAQACILVRALGRRAKPPNVGVAVVGIVNLKGPQLVALPSGLAGFRIEVYPIASVVGVGTLQLEGLGSAQVGVLVLALELVGDGLEGVVELPGDEDAARGESRLKRQPAVVVVGAVRIPIERLGYGIGSVGSRVGNDGCDRVVRLAEGSVEIGGQVERVVKGRVVSDRKDEVLNGRTVGVGSPDLEAIDSTRRRNPRNYARGLVEAKPGGRVDQVVTGRIVGGGNLVVEGEAGRCGAGEGAGQLDPGLSDVAVTVSVDRGDLIAGEADVVVAHVVEPDVGMVANARVVVGVARIVPGSEH